ncbi:MAG: T9SS type A sorting domain-containing protein [Chitinophagaceae bacterium]
MKNIKTLITFFIAIICFNQKINAQAGTLDPTFGEGGVLIVDASTFSPQSLIQPDGKILMNSSGNLDRFNPDGSYDEGFGINGRSTNKFNGKVYSTNNNFTLQEDGKILCLGQYQASLQSFLSGVFRCNPDGSLDSSFGINALDTVKIDVLQYPTGIVVQQDGKIVVSGDVRKSQYDQKRTFIYRLLPNGGLDPTFGIGGIVVNKHTDEINSKSLIIRPDGKLIMGSDYNFLDVPEYHLESFNQDGSVDAGFGTNGIAKYIFGEGHPGDWFTTMYNLALQTDGKILCTGTSGIDYWHMALCRFNVNGTIDENFGENGGVITPFQDSVPVFSFGVDLQPDGKILTCGGALTGINSVIVVCRYNVNGQLDNSFAENGIATITNDTAKLGATSIRYLPDSKILVTGQLTSNSQGQATKIVLARFNGDNVLAANFKEVKAAQNKDAITITWQTLNESGTKSFTVERSGNANDYVGINTVPAKGVASIYNYTDKNPLDGISYYRIRENAANGTNTFSPVVKVVFNSTGVISLYPNPAKNTVTVKGLNKNITAIIKITDMQGREISSQNFTQSSSAILNIRALAQGTYFVQVAQQDKIVRLKLIKE